ncbi:hypothetical protein PUN4_700061 [Paraburkholderia unamae]|nr:hypothetical protein PUN4_700061 [Paraburkholderia unamae]
MHNKCRITGGRLHGGEHKEPEGTIRCQAQYSIEMRIEDQLRGTFARRRGRSPYERAE